MRRPQPIIILLIVAAALLDFCLWAATGEARWPAFGAIVLLALAFRQASLLLIWLAIGCAPLWIRIIVTSATVSALGYIAAKVRGGPDVYTGVWFVVQTICTLVPLLVLRMAGFRLEQQMGNGAVNQTEASLRPWQFSVGNILQITTALVVPIVLLLYFPLVEFKWIVVIFAAVLSIPGLVLSLAILSAKQLAVRTIAAVLITLFLSAVPGTIQGSRSNSAEFFGFYFLQQALVVAMLFCFRLAGYRFMRREKSFDPAMVFTQPGP